MENASKSGFGGVKRCEEVAVAHFKLLMISRPICGYIAPVWTWETRLRSVVVSLAQCTIALEVVSEQDLAVRGGAIF